jgi:DNA-binding LacI/PurR family transcriptional regulator
VIVSCWNRPIEWQLLVLRQLAAAGLPIVTWGDATQLCTYDCVRSDHETGTHRLVHALARAGKRRILRLWSLPNETPWIAAHNRGYDRAVTDLGLDLIPAAVVETLADRDDPASEAIFRLRVRQFAGYLAEHLHASHPIDGIMVSTDCEAFVASAACRLFGRDDIPVTGYDNYWQTLPERRWEPAKPFATVDKGNHHLGEEMVDLLLQRIAAALPDEPQQRLIEQRVIMTP